MLLVIYISMNTSPDTFLTLGQRSNNTTKYLLQTKRTFLIPTQFCWSHSNSLFHISANIDSHHRDWLASSSCLELNIHFSVKPYCPHHLTWYCRGKPCTQIFGIHCPDSKVNVANMGPTWVMSAPGGPYVCPMNLDIRVLDHWCRFRYVSHTCCP